MRTIYLVRHGQCTDNEQRVLNGHRDTELTELGRKQALTTAQKLRGKGIEVIYASPLKRATETAQIIADALDIPIVHLDKDLMERDFGYLTGKSYGEIARLANKTCDINGVCYFMDGPSVETFPKLYTRAKRVLKRIVKKSPDSNVLIVTHGDTGMMIQAVFYGWDWERGLKYSFWKNAEIFELKEYGHEELK